MTVDHEARIRDLQNQLAVLQRARIRAEHERDHARAAAAQARAQLIAEFGVDSVEAAHGMLLALETDLIGSIDALTAALAELGA